MARRKKTKSAPRRRRRVSGVGKLNAGSMMTSVAGVALGSIAASLLVKKMLSSQSETIQGIAPIALGIAIPMFIKNDLAQKAGYGMIAVGVGKFLSKLNIAGVGDADEFATVSVSGDDLSVLAGDDDFAMAGDDEFAMAGDELSVLAGLDEEA